MTVQEIDDAVRVVADEILLRVRTPARHTPAERGLTYETVTFRAEDGVPLEGWFVPAADAAPVVVLNHPGRTGPSGGNAEEDLAPDIRILHDAGYHVLAYDLRNHGRSGVVGDGAVSYGVAESRDVVGALRWVRASVETPATRIGVFGRGPGGPAAFFALSRAPEEFTGVRCLVAGHPPSVRDTVERSMRLLGVPAGRIGEVDEMVRLRTGFRIDEMSPLDAMRDVRIPTFLYRADRVPSAADDVQAMYDRIPTGDKELVRVAERDGAGYFRRHPSRILTWLDYYLS